MRSSHVSDHWRPMGARAHAQVWVACLLLLFLSGCTTHEKTEDNATLIVDMNMFNSVQGGLIQAELSSFHLLIHEFSPPSELADDILFDSTCLPFQANALFEINNLKIGPDRSIFMEAFRDADCTPEELGAKVYRGGVTIGDGETPQRYVLIPYGAEEFTALPTPSEATRQKASETACETDADCQEQVHSTAFCWQVSVEAKECAMTTLYPLNNYVQRAMHISVPLDNGSVVSVGGIGQANSGVLLGTDTTFEIFKPNANLFEVANIKGFSGQNRMLLHDAVSMGGQSILVLGGIKSMVLQSRDSGGLAFITPTQACWDPSNCENNILNSVTAIDFATEDYQTSGLPAPLYGMRSIRIAGDGFRVLVTGGAGLELSDQTCSSDDGCDDGEWCNNGECVMVTPQYKTGLTICTAEQGSLDIQCEESKEKLSTPRFGHELFCLEKDDSGFCTKVIIAGGYGAASADIADLYDVESGEITALTLLGDSDSVGGWKWIEAHDKIFAMGGSADFGSAASQPPRFVKIQDDTIEFETLDCADDDDTLRTFHELTTTSSGSVIVVGGLDKNSAASNTVLLIDSSGNIFNKVTLTSPRFAASTSRISDGPLKDVVLVQGGFSLTSDTNALQWAADGAELYVPAP